MRVAGILVIGLDPLRPLDASYRDFLELLAAEVGAAIADADARETERRRSEALEDLDRAKNAFFGDVSHELRTPLTLILGSLTDALERRAGTRDERARGGRRAQRAAARQAGQLADRLRADRLRAASNRPTRQPTSRVRRATSRACSDRSWSARGFACASTARHSATRCTSIGTRGRRSSSTCSRTRSSSRSTGEIAVDAAARGRDGRADRRRHRHRHSPSRSCRGCSSGSIASADAEGRSHEGAGIGLALVHELVQLHGGTVAVESELGVGTSVRVRVPFGPGHLPQRHVVDNGVATRPEALSEYVEEAVRWLPNRRLAGGLQTRPARTAAADAPRIVLVDDNADLRDYLARLLGARWRVTTIADGATALTHLLEHPPDLVLMDLMLPGLDGLSLAARAASRSPDGGPPDHRPHREGRRGDRRRRSSRPAPTTTW